MGLDHSGSQPFKYTVLVKKKIEEANSRFRVPVFRVMATKKAAFVSRHEMVALSFLFMDYIIMAIA